MLNTTNTNKLKFNLKFNLNSDNELIIILESNLTNQPKEYILNEVTLEEIAFYRIARIPSFLLKIRGRFYHTEIPKTFNFTSCNMIGLHKCAQRGHECKRLSALDDKNGGCEKVRNFSKYIEKYSWIKTGYETFNTNINSLIVVECEHYEKPEKVSQLDTNNTNKHKSDNYIWSDSF